MPRANSRPSLSVTLGPSRSGDPTSRNGRSAVRPGGPLHGAAFDQEAATDELLVDAVSERWLRIRWRLSSLTLERAASALGREWRRRRTVLRLLLSEQNESSPPSQQHVLDIDLPDDAHEWYFRVPSQQDGWIIEIRLAGGDKSISVLHSTPVALARTTRKSSASAAIDADGASTPAFLSNDGPPPLDLGAQLVVQGSTRPGATLSIDDQPVSVQGETGQFSWRADLRNGRAVYPLVAESQGHLQRALLALDLNIRVLEPEPAARR